MKTSRISANVVPKGSNGFDLDLDDIAALERDLRIVEQTHPGRRSREHKIPGFQRDGRCDVCDQRRDVEDKKARSRVLQDLAVQPLDDSQIRGIIEFNEFRPYRAERVEAFATKPLSVRKLCVAR